MTPRVPPGSFELNGAVNVGFRNVGGFVNENAFYATLQLAIFSTESMTTNTTKTFTGESSLTGAIVQT